MKSPKFEVYKRTDGKWDWRLVAGNGQIVATSHNQGFGTRSKAAHAARRAAVLAAGAVVQS